MFTCCTICWLLYSKSDRRWASIWLVLFTVRYTGYRSVVRCSGGNHKQWTWVMKWKEEGNMNSWPICEKEPVVNIRTLTSHLLLFLQLFFYKFPEDLLFVFCCRFRKNGFDILFTNCRTNQKFHVLINLKALCIMYKWCAYGDSGHIFIKLLICLQAYYDQ